VALFGGRLFYRIYATPADLLVFRVGTGGVSEGQLVPRTRARHMMPQVGVAGAVARLRDLEDVRYARRIEELDAADEMTLRLLAAGGDGSLLAEPADLTGARVDPPSWYVRHLCGTPHEGLLRFAHRRQGKFTLALPSPGDVRRAAGGLTRLLGDAARVNVYWAAARASRES
jgi:hypothetical protein